MEDKIYVTHRYVKEIEHSEIDFDLYDKVMGKGWSDSDASTYDIGLGKEGKSWVGEGYPIEIDKIIRTLEKLKKSGANFVEIMYHCDHIGYVFNGVDIHKSTEEEVQNHLDKKKKKEEKRKQEEIEALERKLNQLKS